MFSVLFLDQGATYETRLMIDDPDGGHFERTEMVTTITPPACPTSGNMRDLYPLGFTGSKNEPSLTDPFFVAQQLNVGDVLLVDPDHARELEASKDGTPAAPICIRGVSDRSTIILQVNGGNSGGPNNVRTVDTHY